jgi:DNA-directed RNA polymerase subunit RPC12/RpoP
VSYIYSYICPRCGITFTRTSDTPQGICRDCRSVLTTAERQAWPTGTYKTKEYVK